MLDQDTLEEALASFYAEGWITEVIQELKSGKEATAYWCAVDPARGMPFAVAKVYRDQESRGFRNDAVYRAGRYVAGSRERRALANKSAKGREVQFKTWVSAEWETLRLLNAAGALIPQGLAKGERSVLMEFVGDAAGPAPLLHSVSLTPPQANRLFWRLIAQVELWLRNNRVHGDLSPYNILLWNDDVRVIDFPQAVDPRVNPNARELLDRDVENVARYFARFGVAVDSQHLTRDLWHAYVRGAW